MAGLKDPVVVCGGGGFIGGHLVADLLHKGHTQIRSVDIKPFDQWYQCFGEVENLQLDLKGKDACYQALQGARVVYNLAADMGGMGFIENNRCLCMLSVLINTHLCQAAHDRGVERYFYSSSACVYNGDKQRDVNATALKEEDAYPAQAEDGYGWEKLFSERLCRHFREDFGLQTRVALPQRLRPAGHLGWRPRKGARRHLPQNHSRQALRPAQHRNLGRRASNPVVHVHHRLHQRNTGHPLERHPRAH